MNRRSFFSVLSAPLLAILVPNRKSTVESAITETITHFAIRAEHGAGKMLGEEFTFIQDFTLNKIESTLGTEKITMNNIPVVLDNRKISIDNL